MIALLLALSLAQTPERATVGAWTVTKALDPIAQTSSCNVSQIAQAGGREAGIAFFDLPGGQRRFLVTTDHQLHVDYLGRSRIANVRWRAEGHRARSQTWSASSSGMRSTIIPLDYQRLYTDITTAEGPLMFEVPTYNSGSVVFTFDVTGFEAAVLRMRQWCASDGEA